MESNLLYFYCRKSTFLLLFFLMVCGRSFACGNQVLNFNGVSNYVDLGTSLGNGIRSIEFWFRPEEAIDSSVSAPGISFIIRNDASEYHEYGIYIRGTNWTGYGGIGRLCFFVRYSGVFHEIMSDQNSWNAGSWYHVAGVLDNVTGMKLYVNGILQTMADPGGIQPTDVGPTITALGKWGDYNNRFFNGQMDELRIWDRSISQSEIQLKMCKRLNPPDEVGLKAYYNFEEGSGGVVTEQTINAFDGVPYGNVWLVDDYCSSPNLQVSTSSTPANCGGNDGMVTVDSVTGTLPYTYSWSTGASTPTVTNLTSATYTLIVHDANNCVDTEFVNVGGAPLLAVNISDDTTVARGGNAELFVSGGTGYNWYPPDGLSCTTCFNPVATPLETTTYCAYVVDSNGCSAKACVTVYVEGCGTNKNMEVPNAFTPNNDGNNDALCLSGWDECVSDFKISIYDRWGELVFESSDAHFCWDGLYEDQQLDSGVFVYFITATLYQGHRSFVKKGNISLIR